MNFHQELLGKYTTRFGEKLKPLAVFRNEMSWQIDAEILLELAESLKLQDKFHYLVDITSVDNFGGEPRFEVVYELCSFEHAAHLRLKISVSEENCKLPSVCKIWNAANWHEREIFDMMGIHFNDHPDLRRILMWDDYPFYPLRKDFPLEGRPSSVPDVAFTKKTPMTGGPFITTATNQMTMHREPHSHSSET